MKTKPKKGSNYPQKISIQIVFPLVKETNTLHVDDEPQEVDTTSFLYNLKFTQNERSKYSKILNEFDLSANLVYDSHAKKNPDQFCSEDENKTVSKQPKRKQKKTQQKQPEGRLI